MYICTKCHNALNKFDATFNKELFPDKPMSECKCFECTIGGATKYAIEDYEKKSSFLAHISVYIALLIVALPFILRDFHYIFGGEPIIIETPFIVFCVVLAIVIWIWGGFKVLSSIGMLEKSDCHPLVETGSHFETSFTSSGTAVTKEVVEYSGGGGIFSEWLANLVFVLLSPYWSIIHLIYRSIKIRVNLHKHCPKEVFRAYKKAKENNEKYIIPQKDIRRQIKITTKYADRISYIVTKYSCLGKKDVEKRISEIEKPVFQAKINNKKRVVVACGRYIITNLKSLENLSNSIEGVRQKCQEMTEFHQGIQDINNCCICLHKDENNKLVGKVIIKNYELYSKKNDWISEWREWGIDTSEDELTDLYSEYL